ncbi:trichohyalin isoform X2 [Diachasmimorpha longicaudata]|uniref:trichohyalin isoform X2 n=1 Tax=Diachasmimorpha longicaudata TaxID=58733 RepID=UPI0030B885D3
MPSSQAAATERRNDRMMAHEPPKLKTTLKTPPKQATNPLQFVKVGPCSLYRTAQEQLQKVQEVKKVKQEVRDDPEDWQSNLDNWKTSRRKRQEHIIERVVEVKKLELKEHDRQRKRSKTFSEMMEERGNRGRKLSMNLAMYQEEDSNDLSDLGIGTSSGKSSVSGDTHDDIQSVLSDRDSEIDKNHSDLDNVTNENGNGSTDNNNVTAITTTTNVIDTPNKKTFDNGFITDDHREYDSGTTATVSSPEPEEYTYEGAIRGYVSRVAQNIPRRSLIDLEVKLDSVKTNLYETKDSTDETNFSVVKVDILKRREVFEKASQINADNKINNNNRLSGDFSTTKSIKERLSNLDKQMHESEQVDKNTKSLNRLSGDMSSIRERLSHLEKQATERESKISRKPSIDELEPVRPLRERLSTLEKYASSDESCSPRSTTIRQNGRTKEVEKKPVDKQILRFNNDNSTPSERSSSPDSEYRAPRAAFHRSLDSLDADASSGPDTFERVQSLEELDYTQRYPACASSAELLNDTDREDSGIHTADVSCAVSQADEPVDEEIVQQQQVGVVETQKGLSRADKVNRGDEATETTIDEKEEEGLEEKGFEEVGSQHSAVITEESIVIGSSSVDEEIVVPQAESTTPVEHEEVVVCTSSESMVEVSVESPVTTRTNVEQKTEIQIDSDTEQVIMSIVSLSCDTETNRLTFEEDTIVDVNTMEFIGTLSPTSKQIPQLDLENDEEIVAGLTFPLGPPSSGEPPKEKPPPPPTDFSDEENQPIEPLKRLNSTRRIKKELRTRRSDFLGIEGINDDDLELSLARPPDMAAILAEERRIEQLHRRSYDTDSNYEQDSSHERDSGVELGHADDWVKQPVSPDMSQHSRQSSEPFGASVTSSEEDEITKKEREIIEVLEKEEQWRYGSDREQNSDIGEKLADKLRELEEEKMQLERERQEETLRKNDENARKQEEEKMRKQQQQQEADEKIHREEELRIKTEQLRLHDEMLENERRTAAEVRRQEEMRLRSMEDQIRNQEKTVLTAVQYTHDDEYPSGEVLRVERELLQLEQEELKRQRSNMAYREQKQQQLAEQLQEQWQSLQDVNHGSATNPHPTYQNINALNYRSSMPNLQLQEGLRRRPPPPPIPPAKPLRVLDQRQRDATIRNSRIPSADSIPQQVNASLRHSVSTTALAPQAGQQMTKQTLQALSAVPRTRIVKNDQWVQRRKSDGPRITQDFNYQHWLIQTGAQCQPGTAVNTPSSVPSASCYDASKGASITGSLECRVTGENAQCQWKEEMLSLR